MGKFLHLFSMWTRPSSLFGCAKGYPVVVWLANLLMVIWNGEGFGSGLVVSWLPIVSVEYIYSILTLHWDFITRWKMNRATLANQPGQTSRQLYGTNPSRSSWNLLWHIWKQAVGWPVEMTLPDCYSPTSSPCLQIMKNGKSIFENTLLIPHKWLIQVHNGPYTWCHVEVSMSHLSCSPWAIIKNSTVRTTQAMHKQHGYINTPDCMGTTTYWWERGNFDELWTMSHWCE